MTSPASALTTDLYELNMVQAYLDRGEEKNAVFEFFVRKLPARRGFLLAAGLEDALAYLETLHFSSSEIDWLKSTGRFRPNLIDYQMTLDRYLTEFGWAEKFTQFRKARSAFRTSP